jgi:hypothetical protein
MTSVCRAPAQVAPKKNFVVDVDNNNYGDMFLQVDFDTWYAANAASITKIGSVYVVKTAAGFYDAINNSNPLDHVLGNNFLSDYNKHTLVDMGKEICIGIPSDPRMLVFRQVALPFNSSAQGTGLVGYVVTENSVANLTRPRFHVAVARA